MLRAATLLAELFHGYTNQHSCPQCELGLPLYYASYRKRNYTGTAGHPSLRVGGGFEDVQWVVAEELKW